MLLDPHAPGIKSCHALPIPFYHFLYLFSSAALCPDANHNRVWLEWSVKPSRYSTGPSSVPSHISHAADPVRTPLLLHITNHTTHLSFFAFCEGMPLLCEGQSCQVVSGLSMSTAVTSNTLSSWPHLSCLSYLLTPVLFPTSSPQVLLTHLYWLLLSVPLKLLSKDQQRTITKSNRNSHIFIWFTSW